METIRLTIPNMKSQHCIMTVAGIIKEKGASVRSIVPMQAEIAVANSSKQDLIAAIERGGHKVNS